MWQKAAHGRFSRIHQVAPICTPCNTMLLWVHPSPQPKRHLDRFSHFCVAQGGVSLYFAVGRCFPQHCTISQWCPRVKRESWRQQADVGSAGMWLMKWCMCVFVHHWCYITLACVCVAVMVLGYKHSSASRKLTDKCRRHSRQPRGIFRFSREQTACRSSAAAVAVPRTISHRHEFVLKRCLLMHFVRSLKSFCRFLCWPNSIHFVVFRISSFL